MKKFALKSGYKPKGDQPKAIASLVSGLKKGHKDQVLLGVTGSGKTFTMANVIERMQRPALVIAPNKTLAAQLYSEFKELFPGNAVEYFVSYYDYYQPEAYIASSDTYIAKDASINKDIEKLRHSATRSLLDRKDVIVVASVSCIYGLGMPKDYLSLSVLFEKNAKASRDAIIESLVGMQYERNDIDFANGRFRVRGGVIDIFPVYEDRAVRLHVEDRIGKIEAFDPLTGKTLERLGSVRIYPAKHYVVPDGRVSSAVDAIGQELRERLGGLRAEGRLVEAARLEQRTRFDLEMIREMGYCTGIENYSRYFEGRSAGKPPSSLLDYFPEDCLVFIDESHITVPQIGGMYAGDKARKDNLVYYGFRLPSALDNRPLRFQEFDDKARTKVYVSATPGPFEMERAEQVVEQLIRPTGLVDPAVEVRGSKGQVDDLIREIKERVKRKERVLVTTLTKRMSEELAEYLGEAGIKVRYIHSEVDTIERMELLRGLRSGESDCLVGINLLREGLDLPEVSLVAILDADKEGFLRSEQSLVQTIGRVSRNVYGKVILYADSVTGSMERAIKETERRRKVQLAYNKKHGITPRTIVKNIHDNIKRAEGEIEEEGKITVMGLEELESGMKRAADEMNFELAAKIRDRIIEMEKDGKIH